MDCWLITYDIPDDKRRVKLSDALKDYGQRVQFSVFEVWLDDAMRRALWARIDALIDPTEDSVRLYALCGRCHGRVQVIGMGSPPAPPAAIIL